MWLFLWVMDFRSRLPVTMMMTRLTSSIYICTIGIISQLGHNTRDLSRLETLATKGSYGAHLAL